MKVELNKIKALAMDAYSGRSSKELYSAEEREAGLRTVFSELMANNGFSRTANREAIFEIVTSVLQEITPKSVRGAVDFFCEFKTFKNNQSPEFILKNNKIKACKVAVGGKLYY